MASGMTIGLLGFGEVGQTLADDFLHLSATTVRAYDVLFADADSVPGRALAECPAVAGVASAAELPVGCSVVISAVTAAEDEVATRSIAAALEPDTYVMDVNSVAPGTRRRCAGIIEEAGGRYVEAAVMSPIHPRRSASPILLGGAHAASFLPIAQALGFAGAVVFSADIGTASATKMCRSVIIKGIEALLSESLLVARHYGVESEVLDSLGNLLSTEDWSALAQYMIGRAVLHGQRRAEEMREAAATVRAAGIDPLMTEACVARQEWTARFMDELAEAPLTEMLDAIRRRQP